MQFKLNMRAAMLFALAAFFVCAANSKSYAITVLTDGTWGSSSYVCAGLSGCLPAYTSYFSGGGSQTLTQSYTDNGTATATGIGSVPSNASPSISVTSTVVDHDPNVATGSFADALMTYTYYVELLGPTGTISVNITRDLSSTNNFLDSASLNITYDNGAASMLSESVGGATGVTSINGTITESMIEGTPYEIVMTAAAAANGSNPSGSASIDPFMFLNQVDINDGYSLIFSPNVANGPISSTPLPATLPLFFTGIAGLGALGLRKKRKKNMSLAAA